MYSLPRYPVQLQDQLKEYMETWQGDNEMKDSDVPWLAAFQLNPYVDNTRSGGIPVITPEKTLELL